MATFNTFTDILPDPANPITDAGSAGLGSLAPASQVLDLPLLQTPKSVEL